MAGSCNFSTTDTADSPQNSDSDRQLQISGGQNAQNFIFAPNFPQNGEGSLGLVYVYFKLFDENFSTRKFSHNFCYSSKFGVKQLPPAVLG